MNMLIETAPGTVLVNKIHENGQVTGGVEKSPYAWINTAE
jgi:hypothetical protein